MNKLAHHYDPISLLYTHSTELITTTGYSKPLVPQCSLLADLIDYDNSTHNLKANLLESKWEAVKKLLEVTAYNKESKAEKVFEDKSLVTDDYTLLKPISNTCSWFEVEWLECLDVLKESKKLSLRSSCDKAISLPFQSGALGSSHSYDCREIDQTNLQRMVTVGNGGSIWAHDGTEFLEKTHTHEESLQVLSDMQVHEQNCRFTKLKPKIAQVNAITEDTPENRAALEAIAW